MNDLSCPTAQLPMLIDDQLSNVDAERVLEHLESCAACRSVLESLTADNGWWQRVQRGLAETEIDSDCRLADTEPTHCSIDTLLEGDSNTATDVLPNVLGMLDPPSHPELLGQIDEFEVEAKIGQGGMGVVFRAFDRSLNRPVAIKVMAPHLGSIGVARERFEREARAAAAVVHPSVVPIYRVSTTRKDRPYIAMALADGLNLQQHVNRHGPFCVKDVVRIAIQIAGGLAEAHKQGLIHRDIKPANVLLEKDVSRIMITDFGLARAVDDVMMTQSGCLAGTPNYMSPEQVIGEKIDHRSDLFSLGALMYFIATGREPFRAESAFAVINKITFAVPDSARKINGDIPEVLNRIIERLLEKNATDRIESAAKLEEILTQVLAHLQEPTQHALPSVKVTTIERRQHRRLILAGLIVGVIVVVAGLTNAGWFGPTMFDPSRESDHRHGEFGEHIERHESHVDVRDDSQHDHNE